MSNELSRKDFIKLLSLGLAGQFLPRVIHQPLFTELNNDHPNILILVFDAWTDCDFRWFGFRIRLPEISRSVILILDEGSVLQFAECFALECAAMKKVRITFAQAPTM